MSKLAMFAVAWVVAAAVALGVAWQGVDIVGQQVTQTRPAPLTARELQDRASAATRAAAAPTTSTTTAAAVTTTTPAPSGGPDVTGPTTSRPPSQPSRAVTTTTAPPVTTTSRAPAPATTRTYTVTGGSASLRFSSSGVTVLWANPNAGFDVKVEGENANGVKVLFESSSHRSRIDGWWDGGPQDRVREENR